MKAFIVDGEELFRLSMREVISVAADFEQVIEVGNQTDFLAKTASHDSLDLVVIHPTSLSTNPTTAMEEGNNCLNLVKRLYPDAAIVIIADREGAASNAWTDLEVVSRSASVSTMVFKIRKAMKLTGDTASSRFAQPSAPNVRSAALQTGGYGMHTANTYVDMSRLSYRQGQILAMAAGGLPNKEIAARLGIAEGTVKAHMHAIFKVLDVSNRTQAVLKYGAMNVDAGKPDVFEHRDAAL